MSDTHTYTLVTSTHTHTHTPTNKHTHSSVCHFTYHNSFTGNDLSDTVAPLQSRMSFSLLIPSLQNKIQKEWLHCHTHSCNLWHWWELGNRCNSVGVLFVQTDLSTYCSYIHTWTDHEITHNYVHLTFWHIQYLHKSFLMQIYYMQQLTYMYIQKVIYTQLTYHSSEGP